MSDLELLELAAKAAGYDYRPGNHAIVVDGIPGNWNPLDDDGDALRLAVKLRMKVYPGEAYPWCASSADYRLGAYCDEDECADPLAATRRAIVRAAAEIAKASPSVPVDGGER